jgi:hypothetical protein
LRIEGSFAPDSDLTKLTTTFFVIRSLLPSDQWNVQLREEASLTTIWVGPGTKAEPKVVQPTLSKEGI